MGRKKKCDLPSFRKKKKIDNYLTYILHSPSREKKVIFSNKKKRDSNLSQLETTVSILRAHTQREREN